MSDIPLCKTVLLDGSSEKDIVIASDALLRGDLVSFPTETVYGLWSDARNEKAVADIFRAKGRPADNPLIVHVGNKAMIAELVEEIPPMARCLMEVFMPGPITLVMRKAAWVPDIVTAGLPTVGVRIPNHPVALAILSACGIALAAPSANVSSRPSATRADHVLADFEGRIPYVVDGGACDVGIESTVVDVSDGYPVVLRPGAITKEMIRVCLEEAGFCEPEPAAAAVSVSEEAVPRSPGMKYRHYAPSAPVSVVMPIEGDRVGGFLAEIERAAGGVGVFCDRNEAERIRRNSAFSDEVKVVFYTVEPDVAAHMHGLFDAFRFLEKQGVSSILAAGYEAGEGGLEWAYMNRLRKAASDEGRIVSDEDGRMGACVEDESECVRECQVLFVCTGNTCRSPMAEAILVDMAKDKVLRSSDGRCVRLRAVSAGVAADCGTGATFSSEAAVRELWNLDLSGHRSQPVTPSLMEASDLILTVTNRHEEILRRAFPELRERIYSFVDFPMDEDESVNYSRGRKEVTDPFGWDLAVYIQTAEQLHGLLCRMWKGILRFLAIYEFDS